MEGGRIFIRDSLRRLLQFSYGSLVFGEPVGFEAAAEGHAGAMEHDPEVVFRDIEHFADLAGLQTVHFAEVEDGGDIFGEPGTAIPVGLPEEFVIEAFAGGGPFLRGVFLNPAALAGTFGDEIVAFLVAVKVEIGEGGFAAGLAEMVVDLVFEDADQPAFSALRPAKFFPPLRAARKVSCTASSARAVSRRRMRANLNR